MKKIFIGCYNYSRNCPDSKAFLEANGFEVIENQYQRPYSKQELMEIAGDLDVAITGVDIWDEELIAKGKKLKLITKFGIGVDNIDVAAATARGIKVSNAQASTNAVAELVIGFMVALERNLMTGNRVCKAGRWDRIVGGEIAGKNIGLVGFGKIPKLVARKLSAFDANVFAFDKYPDEEAARRLNVRMVGFDELLAACDIVSLHLPSTPDTRKTIGAAVFSKMKDGAFFINTGRGAIVDEDALYEALSSGKLAGAAADVFDPEPPLADNRLFTLENFICTPHWGSDTIETIRLVGKITAQAAVDVVCAGIDPENYLNKPARP
jgi:D-3-phosphoglycerate dehydrogenase / 2-oxoglutarate reductase